MSKVAYTIDNLFGGVSRRPQTQRLPSQADEQTNMLSRNKSSVSRRPPLEHLAKVLSSTTGYADAFMHQICISDTERYVAVVINGDLKVYDEITGAEVSVQFPNGKAYIDTASRGFRAVTIGSKTYLVNCAKTAHRGTATSPAVVNQGMVFIKAADYDTKYIVTLNGLDITYTTASTGRTNIATDYIAAQIIVTLQASAVADSYTFTQYGSAVHIKRNDGADFTLAASDGLMDEALIAIKGTVQRFTDLPAKAKDGFTVEITGDDSTEFDNYYVQYVESKKSWQEVVQPGIGISLDASTMPHLLEYEAPVATATVGAVTAPVLTYPPRTSGPTRVYTVITYAGTEIIPPGAVATLQFRGSTYTYTNNTGGNVTPATVLSALQALADPGGNQEATLLTGNSLQIAWLPILGDHFGYTVAVPPTTSVYSSALALTPSSLVGKTARNVTDGSTGTITSNTATTIVCSGGLSGGVYNTFAEDDSVEVIDAGTYFVFKQESWSNRTVGDATSAPLPSFVGAKIEDVFEAESRLGFLSGPNAVMSRAGDFVNFFRGTATQVLADDPIDVRSALKSSPAFHSAVRWNGAVLLFSDYAQFLLSGSPVLSPTTVSIEQIAGYQSITKIHPVVLGDSVYFASLRGRAPILWELRIRGPEQIAVAEDVTQHIHTYIPGTPLQIEVDDALGLVFFRTDADRNTVYVYATQYENMQRTQDAWSKWPVAAGAEVLSARALKGRVTFLSKDVNGIYLNTLALDLESNPGTLLDGEEVYLDRLVQNTTSGFSASYSSGVTTWILPYYTPNAGQNLCVLRLVDGELEVLPTFTAASDRVSAYGDYSADTVFIGVRYESLYSLSQQFRRDPNGLVDLRGRLFIAWLTIRYENTTDLSVDIDDTRRYWYFDGETLLDGSHRLLPTRRNLLSVSEAQDGEQRIHIGARSENVTIDIYTDSHGAMNITSLTWEGEVHDARGSRF